MENNISTVNRQLNNDNIYETILNIERKYRNPDFNEIKYGLSVQDGKNFFRYLKNFNLSNDPDLLILPPNNHYYFDENELRNVRTLINLKNLNLIKDLNTFLYTLINLLPADANFLGYFSYNKISLNGDKLFSGLSAILYNILDSKTDHNLDKKELSNRLQKFGFKVIDMTEMNGLTFFYTKKINPASSLNA